MGLLNRITYFELNALRDLGVQGVLNDLSLDSLYQNDPERPKEVLQSWEAVRELNRRLLQGNSQNSLRRCVQAIGQAERLYDSIPLPLDGKSNSEHLEPLREGIGLFARLAEIEPPTD